MRRQPLVLDDSQQIEQLQATDDIPLSDRVTQNELKLEGLINFLRAPGFDIPEQVEIFN